MALEVRKKERETAQSLVRRFTQRVQKSGILLRARKKRFFTSKISETAKKKKALRKEELRKKYEKLEKLGGQKE
jgi:ribosomal protein S21